MLPLVPGAAHPHPPMAPDLLARRLGVTTARMRTWLARGLPCPEGAVDPVMAAAWVADHALAECPRLARRWRRFLGRFARAAVADDAVRIQVVRRHALCLPPEVDPAAPCRWRLPVLGDDPGQRVLADGGAGLVAEAGCWRIEGGSGVEVPGAVELRPRKPAVLPPAILAAVLGFIGGARYAWQPPARDREPPVAGLSGRSCIGLAADLGMRLADAGWPVRLVAGVLVRMDLPMIHAWIEVQVEGVWHPVDPTPAVAARQFAPALGLDLDWRSWGRRWCGGTDTVRLTLARGPVIPAGRGPTDLGPWAGGVVVHHQGLWRDAWPCVDWALGEHHWSVSTVPI